MKNKVAIIGHMVADPTFLPLSGDLSSDRVTIRPFNYTRVVTPDGFLADHIAFLKRELGMLRADRFSVWEMQGCTGLLLASHLRRHRVDVCLENYIDDDIAESAFDRLRDFDPNTVVISTTFMLTQKHLLTVTQRIRQEVPNAWILAGGHYIHATLSSLKTGEARKYLSRIDVDGVVNDSQGEAALLDFCRRFPDELNKVPNLIWQDHQGITHFNDTRPEQNDIDSTVIDLKGVEEGSVISIRTARSCKFKCAFCSYPEMAGPVSLMDLDHVMTTLRQARDLGAKAVIFIDDTFNVPKDRFEALLDRMLQENINVPWYSFLRCQFIDERIVKKMARSGCAGVFLGIESGSDMILKNMKKGAVKDFYWTGIEWLRGEGILTVGSFIVGFPGDTAETVSETAEFIDQSGLDYHFTQPFYYLHNTPIHRKAEKFGLQGSGLRWKHNTMNWQEAMTHISNMFCDVTNSTFINPDYTLWEIAFLRARGMGNDDIKEYRKRINQMTREQMRTYSLSGGNPTSRPEASSILN